MSTELTIMKRTGSRNIELIVTRFYGGKNGVCLQLTGIMEEGNTGYVQLNVQDMKRLIKIWKFSIDPLNKRTL